MHSSEHMRNLVESSKVALDLMYRARVQEDRFTTLAKILNVSVSDIVAMEEDERNAYMYLFVDK